MSTRWQIAAKVTDGRYGCIYVHCDGYPTHALKMLQEHYTDQRKIDQLIALGDCLSVAPEIENCDTFASRGESWDDTKPTYGEDAKAVADGHRTATSNIGIRGTALDGHSTNLPPNT